MASTPFRAVVLSGGGIKGLCELGALHYFFEKGLLDLSAVQEYSGTSVGSIIGLLLICGYTPMEIFGVVYTKSSEVGDFVVVPSITDALSHYGLMTIEPLLALIGEMVTAKLGKIPTLKELYLLTGKTLYITAANISKQNLEYFSHHTRPRLSVVDAVKISCNLPLIFQKIRYNGDYYIDGGLMDNFPIEALSTEVARERVLGIIVSGVDGSKDFFERGLPELEGGFGMGVWKSLANYIYHIVIAPMNTMTQLRSRSAGPSVTLVKMVVDGVSLIDFAAMPAKKMDLFKIGYEEAARHNETLVFDAGENLWDCD